MDYRLVLERLLTGFDRLGVRYALMGGFAMGLLGAPRATQDLDFLVLRDDVSRLSELLGTLGYRIIHHSDDVSQYAGENAAWGCIDFIHAYRELAVEMLERAREVPVFSGARRMRVLTVEDVIGLKVQAMANRPERRERETADIQALAAVNVSLDWERVSSFYGLFGMEEELRRLKEYLRAS